MTWPLTLLLCVCVCVCYWSCYIVFFQNFYNSHLHAQKIPLPSPNLQRKPAQVAHHSKAKVNRSSSAAAQLQKQCCRSPTSPVPVPQIYISPQNESDVRLRHHNPQVAKFDSMNSSTWNANLGNQYKRRSASPSPCRRGEQRKQDDENGNNLQHNRLKLSVSQECLVYPRQVDLSSSAPEHSLRNMMEYQQRRRMYSEPHGNRLLVPGPQFLPSMSCLEEKENNKRDKLGSSQNGLSSLYVEDDLRCLNMTRQNTPRTKHTCGQDLMCITSDLPQKSKAGIFSSIIKGLGLSPRVSPCHSPASSRSASPNSSKRSSPCSSPFNQSVGLPVDLLKHFQSPNDLCK